MNMSTNFHRNRPSRLPSRSGRRFHGQTYTH